MIAFIVILIRLLLPLSLLRYPLFGAILSILLDSLDWHVLMYLEPSLTEHYQSADKLLDMYYLSLEAYVVTRWKEFNLKTITLGFFIYRCVGVLLFELTGNRSLLFFFPNVFELLFLYIMVYKKDFKTFPFYSHIRLASFVSFVILLKLFQEYMMHVYSTPYWKAIEGR